MTRLLEGLTFTETEPVAENKLRVDTKDELLKKKEKEIEDMKRGTEQQKKENEEQKKRIAELEATRAGGAGTKEVWILIFYFLSSLSLLSLLSSNLFPLCCTMVTGCGKVGH